MGVEGEFIQIYSAMKYDRYLYFKGYRYYVLSSTLYWVTLEYVQGHACTNTVYVQAHE